MLAATLAVVWYLSPIDTRIVLMRLQRDLLHTTCTPSAAAVLLRTQNIFLTPPVPVTRMVVTQVTPVVVTHYHNTSPIDFWEYLRKKEISKVTAFCEKTAEKQQGGGVNFWSVAIACAQCLVIANCGWFVPAISPDLCSPLQLICANNSTWFVPSLVPVFASDSDNKWRKNLKCKNMKLQTAELSSVSWSVDFCFLATGKMAPQKIIKSDQAG